ncbi:unnamed protein product [Urochloa humidicola]
MASSTPCARSTSSVGPSVATIRTSASPRSNATGASSGRSLPPPGGTVVGAVVEDPAGVLPSIPCCDGRRAPAQPPPSTTAADGSITCCGRQPSADRLHPQPQSPKA